MTAGRRAAASVDTSLCRRCQERQPEITVRSDSLCLICFDKYVQSKIVKRMESFRVRNTGLSKPRDLLLPVSLGACSVSLLHVLSSHLKRQSEKAGKTGYALHVLHIKQPGETDEPWQALQARYPEHAYSTCALADVLMLDTSVRDLFSSRLSTSQPGTTEQELESLLSSMSSTTAQADVHDTLRTRLLVAFAKSHDCEAILFGDSTTRLSERTLAETAKGRGFALPWLINDGQTPQGIPFYYPMRELLTREVLAFAEVAQIPYLKDERPTIVSSRKATINSLMQQYFQSAEQDYPAIVSNVVRTTGKLRSTALSTIEQQCELCEMPLQDRAPERSRLCYGCIRSLE